MRWLLALLPVASALSFGVPRAPSLEDILLGPVKPIFALDTKQPGWKTFTVQKQPGNVDDSPAIISELASGNYSSNSTILFPKGYTYNIFTPLTFTNLTNVEVVIEGNLTLPADVAYVQSVVAASTFSGHWFRFNGGTNVILRGTTDKNWGWTDSHGQLWWNTNNLVNRPHGWGLSKITNVIVRDMKLWQPVAWSYAISGSKNVHAFHNVIHAKSNGTGFPFNTDGFGGGADTVLIERNWIVNGDDCITVGTGGKNVHVRDMYCEGGHGLSIGSLGKGGAVADVQNILIENVFSQGALYGARFKSWTGGNGLARNVTWRNMFFNDVPFPIYITQNYWDQNLGGPPDTPDTNSTHIADFTFQNFVGVIRDKPYVEGTCVSDPCWYYVPGATGREVAILDLYPDTATNVVVKGVLAFTQTGREVDVMCDSTTVTNDVGFKCWNGPYIPTRAGLPF